MEQYIPKSALVTEIEKIEEALKNSCEPNPFGNMEECMTAAEIEALNVVKAIINTLEVKEVNLDKELDFVKDAYYYFTSDERNSMKKVAKHFFELGLKAKGE